MNSNIQKVNFEAIMDSLFREFLSQPGERQICSELVYSIARGKEGAIVGEMDHKTKDFLKIPACQTNKGSPKGSPVGSPMNVALLSPIFLPPSPRSPAVGTPNALKLAMPTNSINNLTTPFSRDCHSKFRTEYNLSDIQSRVSNLNICGRDAENGKPLDFNSNPSKDLVNSREVPRPAYKGPGFASVFNEAMGLTATPTTVKTNTRKQIRRWVADLAAPKRVGHLPGGPSSPPSSQLSPGRRNQATNLFSLELMQTDDVSKIAAQIANQAELIYQAWKTTDINPSEIIHYHSVTSDWAAPFHSGFPSSPFPRIPVRNISPAPPGSSPATPRRVIEIPISTVDFPSNFYQKQTPSPQFQQPQQHASSPIRTLNTSPRPYIPPSSNDDPSYGSQQSPRISSPSSASLSPTSPPLQRPFSSARVSAAQPPPPPERSSSYVESSQSSSSSSQSQKYSANDIDLLRNPELEDSLRELVTNFVIEDKARLASRPKGAPSTIQDALQRFERQMAITSRMVAADSTEHKTQDLLLSSSLSATPMRVQSTSQTTISTTKKYTGSRNDSFISERWGIQDIDGKSRRSVSPSSQVTSKPAWNSASSSNSTWPIKNKQAPTPEQTSVTVQHTVPSQCKNLTSSPLVVNTPINYITTLEAQLDGQGRTPGIPIRHKIVTLSGINTEEEDRLNHSLSHEEIDSGLHLSANDRTSTTTNRKPKFSISVTVDVENKPGSSDSTSGGSSWSSNSSSVETLSAVDYAKVRFQDAQQHPKTIQRLEDYKAYSSKSTLNGDGRVMQVKSKFEVNGEPYLPEAPWRSASPLSLLSESSLPEFYRRKIRKMRKTTSPEPAHALAALPHPELTNEQKAHIRERSSQYPSAGLGTNVVIRPFLTQGSVAERVLLFEKAPTELKKSAISASTNERRRPAMSTWRDPDEVRTKAQEAVASPLSPPRHLLETLSSAPPTTNAVAVKQNNLREPLSGSLANKENTRPVPTVAPPSLIGLQNSSSSSSSPHITATHTLGLSIGPPLGSTLAPSNASRIANRRVTKASKNLLIPRFYYPNGRPSSQREQEEMLENVSRCFRENGAQISRDNMEPLMRACHLPLYWKASLFVAAGGEKLGHLSQELFTDYWGRVIGSCHDLSSRFVRVLNRGVRSYLLPEDFLSLIQDVVETHPGLTFLKEATEFHSRYVHTVIARIYYCVNRSWSGKITVPELRRSNLLQVINYLEEEEDINKITDFFSYEHFYVIYCKFWELDTDHDLFIDRNDLAKHNERALSDKIIDRIFSGAVTRGRVQKQDRMGYQEFVWFLISEEDKRHPTAIEYWFRCMDLDGDGYLSMYELEYFYEDQLQRMEALGIETLPFYDCLCQMLDMVRPEIPGKISLSDLKKCSMTTVFFDTFFNFDKYLDHEQRDPFASHRMDDEGSEISDWDRYAAEEYELLVAEEGGGDQQDDMFYGDEDELSMGVDNALDEPEMDLMDPELGVLGQDLRGIGIGSPLNKHSSLSATVPNLSIDHMDVDEDYSDYADSDDYQYG